MLAGDNPAFEFHPLVGTHLASWADYWTILIRLKIIFNIYVFAYACTKYAPITEYFLQISSD